MVTNNILTFNAITSLLFLATAYAFQRRNWVLIIDSMLFFPFRKLGMRTDSLEAKRRYSQFGWLGKSELDGYCFVVFERGTNIVLDGET